MFLQGNLPEIAASLHKKVSDTGVIGKENFNEKNFSKEFDMVYLCGICLSVRCADSPCGRDFRTV